MTTVTPPAGDGRLALPGPGLSEVEAVAYPSAGELDALCRGLLGRQGIRCGGAALAARCLVCGDEHKLADVAGYPSVYAPVFRHRQGLLAHCPNCQTTGPWAIRYRDA